jgi:hypothetical protein
VVRKKNQRWLWIQKKAPPHRMPLAKTTNIP